MARRIPIGINVIPDVPLDDLIELVVRAEHHGFDRCWVYDEGLATRDVWITLAMVARATERIMLGPGITNPYTRHPAQTASAASTLAELSGGRVFVGLGTGATLALDAMGLPRRQPVAAVRESVAIVRGLLAGNTIDHDGEVFTLHGAHLDAAPGPLEVWIAGRGPRMLALGGEIADGVLVDFVHKPGLGDVVAAVRAGGPARLCWSTAVVTDHDDLDFVRPHMTYRLIDAPTDVQAAVGATPADIAALRDALGRGLDSAAHLMRDEWIDPFIVRGTISECAAEIGATVDELGIDEFLLPMFAMPAPLRYLDRVAQVLANI